MSELPENVIIDIKAITEAFKPFFEKVREYFDEISKVAIVWFPIISGLHRDNVRAVHTAYRKKKRGRW